MKKLICIILIFSLSFTYTGIKTFAANDSDYTLQSKHFILDIPMDIIKRDITPKNLTRWLNHLDAAYDAYAELVGGTPSGGVKITIKDSTDTHGALWVYGEGHPYIYWQINCIDLKSINNNDDWSFGMLHEIGHLFDIDGRWNWNAEFWANTKMLYVIDKLGAKVDAGTTLSAMKNMYLTDYNSSFAVGNYQLKNHDALTYVFIKFIEKIGWEPFKKNFRSYYNNSYNYEPYAVSGTTVTFNNQFNDFLDRLTYFSGTNVRNILTSSEKTQIERVHKNDILASLNYTVSDYHLLGNAAVWNNEKVFNNVTEGSGLSFDIYSTGEKTITLLIDYACGADYDGGRYAKINVKSGSLSSSYEKLFRNTDWSNKIMEVSVVLKNGLNNISLVCGNRGSAPDFRNVYVVGNSISKPITIASAVASSNWKYYNGAYFSGGCACYISKANQSNFHFNLYSPKSSSKTTLRVYYNTGKSTASDVKGGRYATIYVSGRGYYDIYFPNTDWQWGKYIDIPVTVNAGNNDIGVYWSGYTDYSPDFWKFELIE